MKVIAPDQVRCPTCRALQEWSDTCRRCRSDLSLLRAACSTHLDHRRNCILQLDAACPDLALGHALRCHEIDPGPDSLRLLALCAMARNEWETALELIQQADQQ